MKWSSTITNMFQVNTTGNNVISNIEAILLSQATSMKSVVVNIDTKVKQALATDFKKGLEVLQNLKAIYSGRMQYLAQGMSKTVIESAGMISEVQIIMNGIILTGELVEEGAYTKIRSLSVRT
jgi:hypothetical protein